MWDAITPVPVEDPFCLQASSKSVYSLTLGAILCLGTLLSFLPQHVSLLRSRSSQGISWTWILLSNISSWSLTFNVIGLSFPELGCCGAPGVGPGGCLEILLPVFQVGITGINMLPIFFLYVLFSEREGYGHKVAPSLCPSCRPHHWARHALVALCAVLLVLGLVLGLLLGNDGTTRGLAVGFGIASGLTTLFMWLPQILRTYQDKHPGQLSVLMLCIQLPGNLAAVYFQAIMEQESITTWGSYLVSAVEQAILIFLSLYYRAKTRRAASGALRDEDDDDSTQSDIDALSDAFANDFTRAPPPPRVHEGISLLK